LRILMIPSSSANYQEDVVHEGLDDLLGPEGVFYYPYKPHTLFSSNLYGDSPARPCSAPALPLEEIVRRSQEVGAVIVGSVRDSVDAWRPIQNHFRDRPVAWLHGEDAHDHPWPGRDVLYTHRFQRELLPGTPDILPLPLGIPAQAMHPCDRPKDIDVSFVARSNHPWRKEIAARLAREGFFVRLDAPVSRTAYCDILNRSRIAVSVRGSGYDTMRYWEIPYHGALLLSERLPIVLPDNFVDGESAVFFDSPAEMVDLSRGLLGDPARLERIAAAGRDLVRARHTAVHRARYVLEKMGFT